MNLSPFVKLIADNPNAGIQLLLPGQNAIPAHFHVTEVGKVQKEFIDCGGTVRTETACVLQIWVADDVEHRLNTTKLAGIVQTAIAVLKLDDMPIEAEYGTETIARYSVCSAEVASSTVILTLEAKHAGCLAPDRCGLNVLPIVGCEPTSHCC